MKSPINENTRAEWVGQLVNAAGDGIWAFDKEMRVIFWNQQMQELTGLKPVEVAGKDIFIILPFLQNEKHNLQKALDGEEVPFYEFPYSLPAIRRQGYFEGKFLGLRDREKNLHGGIAVFREVSARKNTQAQLEETEERFRKMADCSPVLLWMSGIDAECNFFNQSWLDFTGRSMQEEIGVGWAEGVHPEDLQYVLDTYMTAFHARAEFEMEYRLRRADGQYRWILDRGIPRKTPEGIFCGFIGSCTDITEHKHGEQTLKSLSEKLLHTNESLRQFAFAASHDLQESVRRVVSYTDLLQSRHAAKLDTETGELLGRISTAGYRMKEIVGDLLKYSSLENLEKPLRSIECSKIVQSVLQDLAFNIEEAQAKIQTDKLPAVRAEEGLLWQLFHNLISNALKFRNNRPVQIDISVQQKAGEYIFAVRDNGIGFEAKHNERIFQIFERLHTHEEYPGTGIGLSICKRIVENLKGRIWCESELGKGACFYFTLPAIEGANAVKT